MREGLRSRTRLGGKDSGVVRKKKGGVKNEALDSGGEGFWAQDFSTEKKGEVESAVKKKKKNCQNS